MSRHLLSSLVIGIFLLQAPPAHAFQFQRRLVTDVVDAHDTPTPHPLVWWTENPLRLDEGRSLLFGRAAEDGHLISASDYRVEQKITTIGTISDHRIVEVITTIHERPSLVLATSRLPEVPPSQPSADLPPTQWKSLLVEVGTGDRYVEIYRLQAPFGLYQPMQSAAVLGVGEDAILGTYDPATGNGGHCSEGYWWFDKAGAHEVDFSPLDKSIANALPPNSTNPMSCRALASQNAELQIGVQLIDAKCHACDWIGEIHATYRIKQGAAIPVSVHFVPTPNQ